MMEVYQRGLELGRDPHVFSVIGDCQSSPTYFLSIYDEGRYTLSEDKAYLQDTIVWYAGSFSHLSITVKNGMTASGVLNPMWGDNELCESREVPVTCEVQMSNPTLVIISLGTNWLPATSYEQYVHYLSEIVNILLTHGVIPVLSTKADNVEGDYSRNLAMAQVAYDYSVPLWNFWAATKDLPNHGLDQSRDNVYLVRDGWDVRNQSALELLDSLRRQLMTIDLRTEMIKDKTQIKDSNPGKFIRNVLIKGILLFLLLNFALALIPKGVNWGLCLFITTFSPTPATAIW